jgi:hypothetical protein
VGGCCEHDNVMILAGCKFISLPGRTQPCKVSYMGNIKLSSLKHVFNPRPVQAEFVVDIMALGEALLQLRRFSRVSIIPSILHTHSFTHSCHQYDITLLINSVVKINSLRSLSYERSPTSSKASSPKFAISFFLFQCAVSSLFLKVIQ